MDCGCCANHYSTICSACELEAELVMVKNKLKKLAQELDLYMADPDDIGIISNVHGELRSLIPEEKRNNIMENINYYCDTCGYDMVGPYINKTPHAAWCTPMKELKERIVALESARKEKDGKH